MDGLDCSGQELPYVPQVYLCRQCALVDYRNVGSSCPDQAKITVQVCSLAQVPFRTCSGCTPTHFMATGWSWAGLGPKANLNEQKPVPTQIARAFGPCSLEPVFRSIRISFRAHIGPKPVQSRPLAIDGVASKRLLVPPPTSGRTHTSPGMPGPARARSAAGQYYTQASIRTR